MKFEIYKWNSEIKDHETLTFETDSFTDALERINDFFKEYGDDYNPYRRKGTLNGQRLFKVGNVELCAVEAIQFYLEHKYVCSYQGIYAIVWDAKKGIFRGKKVLDVKNYAPRGRYYVHSAKDVNHILGYTAIEV